MKKVMNLCMAVVLFAACSSDKLDRDKALQLIQEKKLYPKTISYNVFIADAGYAQRMLDAGLESSGLLTVQRTHKLMDVGKPIVTFTDKAKPYLLPQTDEDKEDKIQLVKIADEVLEEVTGVQILEGDKQAIVEYKTSFKNVSPFSRLSKLKLDEVQVRKVNFELYDDGWRLEE